MPDATLHGNGTHCPACYQRRHAPCDHCGGTGRVAIPTPQIIAAHVKEARAHHWTTTGDPTNERHF